MNVYGKLERLGCKQSWPILIRGIEINQEKLLFGQLLHWVRLRLGAY